MSTILGISLIIFFIIFFIIAICLICEFDKDYLPPMHDDVIINEDTKKCDGDSRIILPF